MFWKSYCSGSSNNVNFYITVHLSTPPIQKATLLDKGYLLHFVCPTTFPFWSSALPPKAVDHNSTFPVRAVCARPTAHKWEHSPSKGNQLIPGILAGALWNHGDFLWMWEYCEIRNVTAGEIPASERQSPGIAGTLRSVQVWTSQLPKPMHPHSEHEHVYFGFLHMQPNWL